MRTKTGRYSGYIRPFSYWIDLSIILFFAVYIAEFPVQNVVFLAALIISWFSISAHLGFYEVYRYTKVITILNCALKQISFFALAIFTVAFFYAKEISFSTTILFLCTSFSLILIIKFSIYFFLKEYRVLFGGNFRRVVLLGNTLNIAPLQHFFTENQDYGYKLIQIFDLEQDKKTQITPHVFICFE